MQYQLLNIKTVLGNKGPSRSVSYEFDVNGIKYQLMLEGPNITLASQIEAIRKILDDIENQANYLGLDINSSCLSP